MVVITDTSPINSLILTGYVDVLPVLHGAVVIPQAVARELRDPRTPERVRQWIAAPPAWCGIQRPQGPADPALADLGDGEREAILLCQELGADALLTDDTEAYDAARAKGIAVIRTLALLERATLQGLARSPGRYRPVTGDDILRPGPSHSCHASPLCGTEPSEAPRALMR